MSYEPNTKGLQKILKVLETAFFKYAWYYLYPGQRSAKI